MTILWKRPWRESVRKLSLLLLKFTVPVILLLLLNLYLLGVEMNLGHAHKTRFWYLLGPFSKFSDEHPGYFNNSQVHPKTPKKAVRWIVPYLQLVNLLFIQVLLVQGGGGGGGNPGARVTLALAHILDSDGRKFAIFILQNLRVWPFLASQPR